MLEAGLASSLSLLRCAVLPLALAFASGAAWPVTPAPAASATAASHADERARIASERNAVEARFRSREDECRQRFIVTSCLDEAKAERRQAIDQLRARQLVVDEARRHQRADERRAELAEKAADDARRESARAAHAAANAGSAPAPRSGRPFESPRPAVATHAASAASGGHDRPGLARAGRDGKPRPEDPKVSRKQREASARAAFEARKAQAIEHRNEAIERTTKRMAQKAPAAPLPPAPAASRATVRP